MSGPLSDKGADEKIVELAAALFIRRHGKLGLLSSERDHHNDI